MQAYFNSSFLYSFELLIALFFLSRVAVPRYSFLRNAAIGLVFFEMSALLCVFSRNNVWINVTTSILSFFLLSYLGFYLSIRLSLLYSLIMIALGGLSELLTIFAQASFSGSLSDYSINSVEIILSGSISKILFFLACLLLTQFIRSRNSASCFPASFLFLPVTTTFIIIVLWRASQRIVLTRMDAALILSADLFLLVSNMLLFIAFNRYQEKKEKLDASEKIASDLKNQQAVCALMEEQNQDLRCFAHDINNHLLTLAQLSSDPKIEDYVTSLSQQLTRFSSVCHSGNPTLDAILNRYSYECRTRHIEFFFDVQEFNLSNIENTDLVTLLTNIMDNAIHAASQSRQKHISLETTTRNVFGVIIISNSCDTAPPVRKGILFSTKKETLSHGLGLKIVGRIVQKYDGFWDWDYDNEKQEFTLTLAVNRKSVSISNSKT